MWMTAGCDDDDEACDFIREADIIMRGAGMNLSKWASNSKVVGSVLNLEFGDRAMVLGPRYGVVCSCR